MPATARRVGKWLDKVTQEHLEPEINLEITRAICSIWWDDFNGNWR